MNLNRFKFHFLEATETFGGDKGISDISHLGDE